jgi:hypothetical protein
MGHGASTTAGSTGGSQGTSSSSGTAGSGSGTTTAGTAGASTSSGRVFLPLVCALAALDDCDAGAGQVELLTQAYDEGKPLDEVVQFDNLLDPREVGVTDLNGFVHLCVPAGSLVVPDVQAPGYVSAVFNDVVLETSECFPAVQLFSNGIWSAIQGTIPGYEASLATIVVTVAPAVASIPCDLSGWTLWITQVDGGAIPFSIGYVSGVSVDPTAAATTNAALAFIYNVASDMEVVRVYGSQDGGPGPGLPTCGFAPGVNEFDGEIHVAGNGTISTFSFLVADAG